MAKKDEMTARIKKLQAGMIQAEFARRLGVPQSRVSEYLAGKRPTAEMCVRLAKLAQYPDNLWFLEQAGLTRDDILSASLKISAERTAPPVEGENVRLPRFRYTEKGREEAGAPVSLPVEFVPNPLSTICICVEEGSARVAESPKGLILLDTSVEGVDWREEFSGHVVFVDYSPKELGGPWPTGLYMGRLYRQRPAAQPAAFIWDSVILQTLRADPATMPGGWLPIGTYREPCAALGASKDDKEAWNAAVDAFEKRALANLRLYPGVRILGKVIGRLTGHLEKSAESAKG